MRRLESEGLVLSRPRRGFIVAYVSRSEIVDVFDARAVLEARGGYLATRVRTGMDVAEVERLLDDSSEALLDSKKEVRRFFELNGRFHDRLLSPLDRPHLKRMISTLRNAGERYIRMSVKLSEDLTPSNIEHRLIYQAYAAGDADEVARLSHDHCIATMQRLLENLANRGLLIPWGSRAAEGRPFRGGPPEIRLRDLLSGCAQSASLDKSLQITAKGIANPSPGKFGPIPNGL